MFRTPHGKVKTIQEAFKLIIKPEIKKSIKVKPKPKFTCTCGQFNPELYYKQPTINK